MPTLEEDYCSHNTGTCVQIREREYLWDQSTGPLTSSTIDNVNLRLRQDTDKVTMSSYLMCADRWTGGPGRYAPIASFVTLCHRRAKHINFRPSRGLTDDDERRGIRARCPWTSFSPWIVVALDFLLPETQFPLDNARYQKVFQRETLNQLI